MTTQQQADTMQLTLDLLEDERERLLTKAQHLGTSIDLMRQRAGLQPKYGADRMLTGPVSPPDPDPPTDEAEPGPDPTAPAARTSTRAGKKRRKKKTASSSSPKWKTGGSGRSLKYCKACKRQVYAGNSTTTCPACRAEGKLKKVKK